MSAASRAESRPLLPLNLDGEHDVVFLIRLKTDDARCVSTEMSLVVCGCVLSRLADVKGSIAGFNLNNVTN